MHSKSKLLSIIILVLFTLNLFGQTKYEREYKVNEQEIPAIAIGFIDSSFNDCKIKWYIEQSQDGKTYEAKTKLNNCKFSVEFDTLGNVLDVEKTIKFETLDSIVKEKINKSLQNEFNFYKIIKTQIQWISADETLQELIVNGGSANNHTLNYELTLKAKKEGMLKFYEVLLDRIGNVIRVSEIIERSTDNLDF